MFGCNSTATIWNKWNNQATKKDEWFRFIIPVMVRWKYRTVRSVSGTSASVVNTYVVIMPTSEKYMPSKEWKALADKSENFTVQKGDVLALGACETEITGITPFKETDVKALYAPDVMTIKSIEDNTRVTQGKYYRMEGF